MNSMVSLQISPHANRRKGLAVDIPAMVKDSIKERLTYCEWRGNFRVQGKNMTIVTSAQARFTRRIQGGIR
jgi:hypothetical protein